MSKKKKAAKKKAAKKKAIKKKKKRGKKDRPWWGKGHTLWGGETFKSKQTKKNLGIKSGDLFRIERDAANTITLIPHPQNVGTWNESHGDTNPIVLTDYPDPDYERAFSMMVQISKKSAPQRLFLFETLAEGAIAITDDIDDPGQDGSTASVER